MTTPRSLIRRPVVIALATFVLGAALSVVGSAVLRPAEAREFEPLVVTIDRATFAEFPGIPDWLTNPRKADPDFCRSATYCDTIPVQIPPPDLPKGAGYKLIFQAKNTDGADLDVYLWDNKQLKEKFGKCQPGEQCYDPLESDYTDLLAITEPNTGGATANGVYTVGEPDLVDYNITVVNFNGVSTGYTIFMELEVETFAPPKEVTPPDNNVVTGGGTTNFSETGSPVGGRSPVAPTDSGSGLDDDLDLPGLNDLLIERDPDLLAIQDQNLADQLRAPPSQIAARGRAESGPPAPVSGLTLLLWFAMVPAGLAGGLSALVQRRRVHIPELS